MPLPGDRSLASGMAKYDVVNFLRSEFAGADVIALRAVGMLATTKEGYYLLGL